MTRFLLLVLLLLASACTPVKPWERGTLAKDIMAFDPDPLESRFRRHVYQSRELSGGGYGVNIGGCGCN
jgi:Domain of unknown function (DUF4266)